jgi:mannose-6-phosphate isomerase-like protein (cupin superfamily)
MTTVIRTAALPGTTAHQFEGVAFGDVPVAFFVSETPPGGGPALHLHPYAEVFVVTDGTLQFVVGDETLSVSGGTIVVVPAGVAHKFTNTGAEIAAHVDIHARGRMETTWLET